MSRIDVECSAIEGGWLAEVTVAENASNRSFEVTVTDAELGRLDPSAAEPTALVRRSFEFLLARESVETILPRFSLSVISRYFPDFEREIRGTG